MNHIPRPGWRRRRGQADRHQQTYEELLELIWTMREEGKSDSTELLGRTREEHASRALEEMVRMGLITLRDGKVILTEAGEERAKSIIRRHRLAERLFSEVLDLDEESMEASACKSEHTLNAEVTDSICTLLGHPPTCPHGKSIPRGECCAKAKQEVKPILVRLCDLAPGQKGRIAFITPRYHSRLDKLTTFGILPGSLISLHQKHPSYVIQVGETQLAVEEEIAREIYVRRAGGEAVNE